MKEANKSKKKKILISLIALISVAGLVLLLSTYAWWTITKKQTNENLVGSACINITFSNETGDIDLQSAWPISDEEAEHLVPYQFTVTNTCDKPVNYGIYLESIDDPERGNTSEEDYFLKDQYVKVRLDLSSPVVYSSLQDAIDDPDENLDYTIRDTKYIESSVLQGKESKTHRFRMWVDENTPVTESSKFFFSKIKIIGGQDVTSECYAINSEGVITSYDPICGPFIEIPDTVSGVKVKAIGTTVFDSNKGPAYQLNSGVTKNDLYFSVAISEPAMLAYIAQDMQALANLTTDDVFYIYYKENQDANIEEAITALLASDDENINQYKQVLGQLGIDMADGARYSSEMPNRPNPGYQLFYKVVESNGSYSASYLGDYTSQMALKAWRAAHGYSEDSRFYSYASVDFSRTTALEKIDKHAFANYYGITGQYLALPSTIKEIGDEAFSLYTEGCVQLWDSELEKVGDHAFANWYGTDCYLSLPYSIKYIGDYAFSNYNGPSIGPYGTTGGFSNLEYIGTAAFISYSGIGSSDLQFGPNLKEIGAYAFANYVNNGYMINFYQYEGSQLKIIGDGAFERYNGKILIIPSSVEKIGADAFSMWSGSADYADLVLKEGLKEIGDSAFEAYKGTGLGALNKPNKPLTIPNTVEKIGNKAFYSYIGPSVTIGNHVKTIGTEAFYSFNTGNVDIPASVTSIGSDAFHSMASNKTITVHSQALYDTKDTWRGNANVVLDLN